MTVALEGVVPWLCQTIDTMYVQEVHVGQEVYTCNCHVTKPFLECN